MVLPVSIISYIIIIDDSEDDYDRSIHHSPQALIFQKALHFTAKLITGEFKAHINTTNIIHNITLS